MIDMSGFLDAPMSDSKGYLKPEEVERVIAEARRFRDRVMMRILWVTGCRLSELLMLTVEDVLWDDRQLLMWTLKRKKKRRYQRLVPIDSETLILIQSYLLKHHLEEGLLFRAPSDQERSLTGRRVEQIVEEAGIAAGIPRVGKKKIHPHHFRHSHCVAWIRSNNTMEGLRELQQRVGHASITTTAHYLQFAAEESRETVERLFGKKDRGSK